MDNFLNTLSDAFSDSIFGGGTVQNPFSAGAFFPPQAMDPQQGGNKGAPPVSLKALRQLPIVSVAPEDLVDENNRECCICLEENHLRDRVMRLPCAHIFHQRCIVDWLTKHCTCPVCRYELPTEDPDYEKSRKARMKHRKPRIHMYVLERMPIHELKQMANELRISWPRQVKSKADILDAFVNSGRIEIIAAPKPVEYSLQDLRAMGVGGLRRAMEEAGVFFDPVDVIEKEDMVQIFCNSGRLVLLPDKPSSTVDKQDSEVSRRTPRYEMPNQRNTINHESHPQSTEILQKPLSGIVVETVDDEDADYMIADQHDATVMFEVEPDQNLTQPTAVRQNLSEQFTDVASQDQEIYSAHANDAMSQQSFPSPDDQVALELGNPTIANRDFETLEDMDLEHEDCVAADAAIAADYSRFDSYSILELRDAAQRMNVDLSRCIERSEMVEKLVRASNGQRLCTEDFEQWSVSDLRALATAVDVNFSQCTERAEMIAKLLKESETRPHVANYIEALMPLATLNINELRAVARRLKVNVADCIEKDEMMKRLVMATTVSPASNGVNTGVPTRSSNTM